MLLVEEVNGVGLGLDGQVVEAQDPGDDEVEEEADEGREAEDSGDAAGQHRHRRPAEVQRLVVVHHVPRVDGHHSWDHDHFEIWLLQR